MKGTYNTWKLILMNLWKGFKDVTSNDSKYCAHNFEQYALVPENLYATTLCDFW